MQCMKTAFRLIHKNSFEYKCPKNKFVVLIAVNPKDGVTNILQIIPTVIIRQVFFLIWDIMVVIQ